MKNKKVECMIFTKFKSKTTEGYPARTILYVYPDIIVIERKYLVPISHLKYLESYKRIRDFKDKVLVSTEIYFSHKSICRVILAILDSGFLSKNINYSLVNKYGNNNHSYRQNG